MTNSTPAQGHIILYRTDDGQTEIQLKTLDNTLWLTQLDIAALFDTSKQNVSV